MKNLDLMSIENMEINNLICDSCLVIKLAYIHNFYLFGVLQVSYLNNCFNVHVYLKWVFFSTIRTDML